MRTKFGLAAILFLFTAIGVAFAGVKPYAGSVDKDIAAGKTVVVHVHADWCSVCRRQQPTIASLSQDGALSDVAFVQVDFDKDQAFLKTHKIPSQSVILVFKGGREVERLIGVTDAGAIGQKIKAAAS